MKKYIVFAVIMTVLVALLIYLYLPKPKLEEIYVISESHYILYESDMMVDIKYFSTTKDILNIENISSAFIYNSDQTIKFQIETLEIKKIHDERYLDALHYGYALQLKLPEITDSYYMESLYIKIDLTDKNYEFFAGSLYVEYPLDNANYIQWYGIEGIKDNLPRLSQILIDVHTSVQVEAAYVGPWLTTHFLGSGNIVLNIAPNDYVFTTTFVKIHTSLGITYLPNFSYFVSYELLNAGLHHNYVIL